MVLSDFTNWQVYIALVINAVFTGIGVAVGTSLAQTHIIEKMKKLKTKIKDKKQELASTAKKSIQKG